ncbi:MAG: hypothetical protein PVJ27_02020 [Candidatus Brocadiaceae bacterium]|jgi:hypothetical protein
MADQGNERRQPAFLVTIDAEGDNLWSRPREVSTRNADYLPRFQSLCESYGLKVTYLVSYAMACADAFRRFAADALERGVGEVGAHPHAWNTPPLEPLTGDDARHQPYLIEYPPDVMAEKVATLTHLLEDTFGAKMGSHRAGRWAFDAQYARVLVEHGYRVDCSVTPHVSWRWMRGAPEGEGGSDYRGCPEEPYFVDPNDVRRPGDSPLLEVPVTVRPVGGRARRCVHATAERAWPFRRWALFRAGLNRLLPPVRWLRPDGHNRKQMLEIVEDALRTGRDYVQLMLHSSELMPGGSPRFGSAEAVERLYDDLEALLEYVRDRFRGMTLTAYRERFAQRRLEGTHG